MAQGKPVLTQDKASGGLILDGHKLLWHRQRLEDWINGKRIAPITIDLALSRSCKYKCLYCYGKLQDNPGRDLNRKAIFDFLDDASDIGVKAISLVGDGESSSSPYLAAAIARARKNGLDTALGTNGLLLKEKDLQKLLESLTYLRFNISAADPAGYALIMGCKEEYFYRVCDTIRKCVKIKSRSGLKVTLGIQMVLMPQFQGQVIPFAVLGKDLGVDYAVIKHCSDDQERTLGVDYPRYKLLTGLLKEAESHSTDHYLVKVKWSKILSAGARQYSRCLGAPFMLQISGTGLVAPCGMFFNRKYKKFHIGNIADTRFKKIWQSRRYWDVMKTLASDDFDAKTMCGSLCLQDKVNEFLADLYGGRVDLSAPSGPSPQHINFI